MKQRTGLMLAGALVVLLAGLPGCGPADGTTGTSGPASTTPTPTPTGSTTPSGTADVTPTPEQVLERAGLGVPAGATDLGLERQDRPPYRESYLLTLKLPMDAAREWCRTGGLNGAGVTAGLTTQEKPFFGRAAVAAGSELCSASWPQDVSWQRTVLIEPGPTAEAAQITAAIYRMPVH